MAIAPETISTYQRFFENLTDKRVENFRTLAAPNMRYRDPLMDSQGIDAVVASMHKWFKDMDEIQFEMAQYAQNDLIVFQHWTMKYRIRKLPKRLWTLEGVSKVTFNASGQVVDQIDYWDTAPMFSSVPLLGGAVKLIKRLFA